MISVDVQLVAVLAVLAALAWYLSWTAGRLDRLHGRVEGARGALDVQLQRRAAATTALATSGLLDPASSVLLAAAADAAREADPPDQELRESELTLALQAVFDEPEAAAELRADPAGAALLTELVAAGHRVELARRFHNDAVAAARTVRRARRVRWLRLAGHAPVPRTFEIDDSVPTLGR